MLSRLSWKTESLPYRHATFSIASADARVESLDWPALAAPIWPRNLRSARLPLHPHPCFEAKTAPPRSEEHTSELQSHSDLVCRLLLEKKKTILETVHTHETDIRADASMAQSHNSQHRHVTI